MNEALSPARGFFIIVHGLITTNRVAKLNVINQSYHLSISLSMHKNSLHILNENLFSIYSTLTFVATKNKLW